MESFIYWSTWNIKGFQLLQDRIISIIPEAYDQMCTLFILYFQTTPHTHTQSPVWDFQVTLRITLINILWLNKFSRDEYYEETTVAIKMIKDQDCLIYKMFITNVIHILMYTNYMAWWIGQLITFDWYKI